MNEIENKKTSKIEIPFGIDGNGAEVSISLFPGQRNHCYIMGRPGSGKTVLLSGIINSLVRNYDKGQVVVWTNLDSEQLEQYESVCKMCQHEIDYEGCMKTIFERLYDEEKRRIGILAHDRVTTYNKAYLPLLVAVIDDFSLLDYSDFSHSIAQKLTDIMRISHTIGMTMICASQLPVSKFNSISPGVADLFNFRISLKSSRNFIIESLHIPSIEDSPEINEKIDNLLSGRIGAFLLYNHYERDLLLDGRVIFDT